MATIARAPQQRGPLAGLITDANYMWWAALPIILGMFIVIMDSSIVNVAISHIMNDFGSNVEEIEWVSTAYMLASAVMMPTTGFLGERFGKKKLYVVAIALFTIASMLCGAAWSAGSLIGFRVFQGVVGGAIQPVAQAILFETFPPEKRGLSQVLVGMGAMFAPMIGPTVGGYLVDYLSWRWIFYVNLVPGIVATAIAWAVLREGKTHPVSFDAWGFSLMATFLTTALLALSQGNSKGWSSPYIVALFAIAGLTFGGFLISSLWRREPVVRLDLFRYFNFAVGNVVSVMMGIGLFGGMFLLPVFLQGLMGFDAIQSGLLTLPQGLAAGVMMALSTKLFARFDPRVPMAAGMGLLGYSLILQAGMTLETSTSTIAFWVTLRGLGMGMAFPALNQLALASVPIQRVGQAAGLFNVTRQVGGSVGIALLSTLLTMRQVFHGALLGQDAYRTGAAPQLIQQLQGHLQGLGASVQVAQQQAGALVIGQLSQQAAVFAYQDVFFASGFAMLLGIVPVVFLRPGKRGQGGEGAGHMGME
jgi:DHA2 family multidrug resistance protein